MWVDFATGCTEPRELVAADLHFGDASLCRPSSDTSDVTGRPFRNVDHMAGEIVRRWNETVSPADIIYVLGDVGRGHHLRHIAHLHGRKHLVGGNRDDLAAIAKSGLFDSITVARSLPGLLLTHIPVHPSQLRGRTVNVHGHLHATLIDDPRYVCVSVEQTDYRPIPLDEVFTRARRRTQGYCRL